MTRLAIGLPPARGEIYGSRPRFAIGPLLASELFASAVGFGVMVHLARRLGPSGLADFEFASAVVAWWLVLVRGGFDTILAREAARRPRLVGPLTDVLIGLRLGSMALAMAAVAAIAWTSGGSRGWVVAVFGLMLIPSAWATDIGLRASGRFAGLAIAQVVRALGLMIGVLILVSATADAVFAAVSVVVAEVASTVVLLGFHAAEHGFPRPRFRRLAWSAVAKRGAVASAHRFLRVSLYSLDMVVLGWIMGGSIGNYAGARRVSFALLAIGLVVPSAVGPKIAKAWAAGADEARSVVERAFEGLVAIVLPATVGLIATSDRWMSWLFGSEFREAGPCLALIAARLPFVIASNLHHSALIACRRERVALQLISGTSVIALILIVPSVSFGPWGVGLSMLAVEVVGAVSAWVFLQRLGVAPRWHHSSGRAIAGCCGVVPVCLFGRGWPLGGVVVSAGLVYAVLWRSAGAIGRGAV